MVAVGDLGHDSAFSHRLAMFIDQPRRLTSAHGSSFTVIGAGQGIRFTHDDRRAKIPRFLVEQHEPLFARRDP